VPEKETMVVTMKLALAVLVAEVAHGLVEQARAVLVIHHQHPLLREITVEAMEALRLHHFLLAAVEELMLLVPMVAVLLVVMAVMAQLPQFLVHL
jgi:hypothetical protein